MRTNYKHGLFLFIGFVQLYACNNGDQKKNYEKKIQGYWGVENYRYATFKMLDSTIVYIDTTVFKLSDKKYRVSNNSLYLFGESDTQISKIIKCDEDSLIISNKGVIKGFIRFRNDSLR